MYGALFGPAYLPMAHPGALYWGDSDFWPMAGKDKPNNCCWYTYPFVLMQGSNAEWGVYAAVLCYDARSDTFILTFQYQNLLGQVTWRRVYTANGAAWNCNGSNILIRDYGQDLGDCFALSPVDDFPSAVDIYPA